MNLVIDIGNTLAKTAVFNSNDLLSFSSFESRELGTVEVLRGLLEKNPFIKNVILSSVVEEFAGVADFLKEKMFFIELSHQTRLPIENLYESKVDGLLLASSIHQDEFFCLRNILLAYSRINSSSS